MDIAVDEVVVEEKVNATVSRNALWIQMFIVGHMVFASHVTTLVKPEPPRNQATKKRRQKTTPWEVSGTTSIINFIDTDRGSMMVTLI